MSQDRAKARAADRNNFDLIRFVAASMVIFVHVQALSLDETLPYSDYFSGRLAVQAFFVISGLLIVQSYDRTSTLKRYFEKRIRRIYPAYLFIVLACAMLGIALTELPLREYFGAGLARYIFFNLLFLNFVHPSLPGVFLDNPAMTVVNGALWTLKIEVAFYVSVPILVWAIRKWGVWPILLAMYLGGAIWFMGSELAIEATGRTIFRELGKQLPGQASYFAVGAAAYYWMQKRTIRPLPLIVAGLALFALASWSGSLALDAFVRPLAVGFVVVGLAYGPYFGNFGKYGDFSYGIYIVHFPIIQTMLHFRLFDDSYQLTIAAYATALLASVALWHLIEKRFLSHSSHYVRETKESADQPIGDEVKLPS